MTEELRSSARLQAVAAISVLALAGAGAMIFVYAPTDALQGDVQRIFYFHVAAAIAAYAAFAVVLGGGLLYLWRESLIADRAARAAAEVGLLMTTVCLVMGMLWAKPIWGAFWTWDARLTSTLVLWIIYAGYLLVRRLSDPGRQAARLAAVVGIFGFIDVPVVHFSVTWWRTQHPGPIIVNDALPAQMLTTFFLTMACTLVLAAVMVWVRYRIETLTDERQHIAEAVPVVAAREPEPVP